MSFYSDNQVDEFVATLLTEPFGYACDVGANNGKLFSNSLHFEERGWIVLCVEPNPLLDEEGRSCRKLWRQVAAGAEDREANFCAVGSYPYASNSTVERLGQEAMFKIQMLRLDRILEEAGFPRLDYLTVDVETYEPEVMKGFNLRRWKPKIIVLEDWDDKNPAPQGYERLERMDVDNIYRRIE